MQPQHVVNVQELTMSTAMVIALCDDVEISRSSGFLWEDDGTNFLITNWHCITGVNPESGKYLSPTGARPTSVRVALSTNFVGRKLGYEVPLFDETGNPRWFVHPTAGEQVDIVAVPLPDESLRQEQDELLEKAVGPERIIRILAKPINQIAWRRIEPTVGGELMVVGYPLNIQMHGFPIWKRATFASEPNTFQDKPHFLNESNHRYILIDCASRQGMSGSPVVQVSRSMLVRGNDSRDFENLRDGHSFYGIYSGRLSDVNEDPRLNDLLAAHIGLVWPRELIERVVAGKKLDTFRREDPFERTHEGVQIPGIGSNS